MDMNGKEEKQIVLDALQMAREAGAEHARINLEKDVENSATVINNEVDKLLSSSGRTLFIQLFIDGRYGSSSTNMLQKDALRDFIRQSADAAKMLSKDECRTLPDPAICFRGIPTDLKQYDVTIEKLTVEERIQRAMQCSSEVWGKHPKLLSIEAEWGDDVEYNYTADTQGFEGETLQSSHTISANLSIKGRGDEKPESWWYESGICRSAANVEGCSSKALQRGLDALNPKRIKSGRYNVILENTISSKFISPLLKALNGAYLQQESSFLKDSLGKRVFGENFTLYDRPHEVGRSGSRLFDADGVATKECTIIDSGVVNTYFINTYYANKMHCPVTVDRPSVLKFGFDDPISIAQMMRRLENGILITDFNGGNCNDATGDFSYGIRGFRFEGGEIVHPIREMNVTGNMIALWRSLVAVGDDPRLSSRWALPSLCFDGVNFSGL